MKEVFFKKYKILKKNKYFFFTINFFYNNKFYVGELVNRWNHYMRFYILYKGKTFYLFNILKTLNNLKRSLFFSINIIFNRGKIFLIDNNNKYKKIFYLFQFLTKQNFFGIKWIGGLITNFKEFFFLQNKEKKKELLEGFWLNKKFGFYKTLTRLPDVGLFLNGYSNIVAINEFQNMGIPMIVIANSDLNPCYINFVLASKDNNFVILFFYALIFAESILLGYMLERNFFFKIIKNFYYLRFIFNLKRKFIK